MFNLAVNYIAKGSPVSAQNVNTPLQQLAAAITLLYNSVQATNQGSTLYVRGQTVEAAALVGMPVWFNSTTQRFERALAATVTDPDTGIVSAAPSAQVWGIVVDKANATLADILLVGFATLDISAAVTGSIVSGVYYLSTTTPGMLTSSRPAAPIAVLRATGLGQVYVLPTFVDILDNHVHYQFSLYCLPAGTTSPPAPGSRHNISAANAALPGWLPANDPSFQGHAPVGAQFGYNLAQHAALAAVWPPNNLDEVSLTLNTAFESAIGATFVPTGKNGLVKFDANGIWWMSDCYADVPWPPLTDTSEHSASWSESVDAVCPRHLTMEMTLRFIELQF
jgi:hypothetical protein